jgi:hypothetical protein
MLVARIAEAKENLRNSGMQKARAALLHEGSFCRGSAKPRLIHPRIADRSSHPESRQATRPAGLRVLKPSRLFSKHRPQAFPRNSAKSFANVKREIAQKGFK